MTAIIAVVLVWFGLMLLLCFVYRKIETRSWRKKQNGISEYRKGR